MNPRSEPVFLFAGQGAQSVGMGKALYDADPPSRRLFEQAGHLLGFDLARVCFEGPADVLQKTNVCQPALLVVGIAACRYFQSRNPAPAGACAGLSLGEYTALVHAGVISFEDGVRLVKHRGEWMQEACDHFSGGMVGVIGADAATVRAVCEEASPSHAVKVANVNSPGQTVISGDRNALAEASERLKAKGYRTIPLKVAGAYHSPLMRTAQERLTALLRQIPFSQARIPVVSNVDGKPRTDPEDLKDALSRQTTSAVMWLDSMLTLKDLGFRRFYEFGPGKVLTGLLGKIDPQLQCTPVETPSDVS